MAYDELVEAVAHRLYDAMRPKPAPAYWQCEAAARAIIPIVLENCAGVAGRHFDGVKDANAYQAAGGAIARAIRNMEAGS